MVLQGGTFANLNRSVAIRLLFFPRRDLLALYHRPFWDRAKKDPTLFQTSFPESVGAVPKTRAPQTRSH